MAIPQGIGGPKIVGSNINGVKSIRFSGQTTSQQTVEMTNPNNVEITNPNNETLTWVTTIKYNPSEPHSWLELSHHTGQLKAHETSNLSIKVDVKTANLARGKTYTAQVVFSWQARSPHGDTLEVTVTV